MFRIEEAHYGPDYVLTIYGDISVKMNKIKSHFTDNNSIRLDLSDYSAVLTDWIKESPEHKKAKIIFEDITWELTVDMEFDDRFIVEEGFVTFKVLSVGAEIKSKL